jgi:hypothetical protein
MLCFSYYLIPAKVAQRSRATDSFIGLTLPLCTERDEEPRVLLFEPSVRLRPLLAGLLKDLERLSNKSFASFKVPASSNDSTI